MAIFGQCILTTAYFPPVEYFRAIARSGRVLLESCENYQKQSYRSRCRIFSTGGVESLSVPVQRDGTHKLPIRDIRIDYSEMWVLQHKRALEAAYNSSAFFEYYKDDIFAILDRKEEYLFDLNLKLLELLLRLTGVKADVAFTEEYLPAYPEGDFREVLQPKFKGDSPLLDAVKEEKTWFQVFSSGRDFIPGLSVIDLLCSEGPNSISFIL